MLALDPIALSVTWGAGGSTRDRSLDLVGAIQVEHVVDTVMHLTCTNMVKGTVDIALRVSLIGFYQFFMLRRVKGGEGTQGRNYPRSPWRCVPTGITRFP